jgi:UDP-GlcNAc3NAcA epimerase
MKILTVLGARPQFIKAATVSRVIKARTSIEEIIIHTGQHFDANMSSIFFEQLDIPRPSHNLHLGGLGHGAMTGRMIEAIETLIQRESPAWVLLYGDTNSTLSGALAAAKLRVPVAHVEAGLRSNNPEMPEEINRVITDRLSRLLFCPTKTAVENLNREGFPFRGGATSLESRYQKILNVGDVMVDAVRYYGPLAKKHVPLSGFDLTHEGYALCTLHRQENTDDKHRLSSILAACREITKYLPVVLPLHPRTKLKIAESLGELSLSGIRVLEPLPYLEMQRLQMSAKVILTDSGGIQKEAYLHGVRCITLRDETEWAETLGSGMNVLAGADFERIMQKFRSADVVESRYDSSIFGDGRAAERVVDTLLSYSA